MWGDASNDAFESADGHATQRRDAGAQARGEIDLATHGGLGRLGHLGTAARLVGDEFDDLVLQQGRVGVEDDEET